MWVVMINERQDQKTCKLHSPCNRHGRIMRYMQKERNKVNEEVCEDEFDQTCDRKNSKTRRKNTKKESHIRQTATNQSSGNRLPMTGSEPLLAVSCQPSRRGRRGRLMALDWPHHSSTTRH